MLEENNCCIGGNCGCHIDSFPTDEMCPGCGRHLRLTGRAEEIKYHLTCGNCGYQSSLVPMAKLHEIL